MLFKLKHTLLLTLRLYDCLGEILSQIPYDIYLYDGASFSSAFDSKSQEMVAIKKLKYPFSSAAQAQRMFREIALMRVCKHKNVSDVQLLTRYYMSCFCCMKISM